jgi:hypothetical protein
LPLSRTSKGNDLYNAVVLYFETENLNLKKIISVTTDGTPEMIDVHQGFVHRLRNDPKCNSDILSYHCIKASFYHSSKRPLLQTGSVFGKNDENSNDYC